MALMYTFLFMFKDIPERSKFSAISPIVPIKKSNAIIEKCTRHYTPFR